MLLPDNQVSFAKTQVQSKSTAQSLELQVANLAKDESVASIQQSKRIKLEKQEEKDKLEDLLVQCDQSPHRNTCRKQLLRETKEQVLDELDKLMPNFDKLCIRNPEYCMRTRKRTCRVLSCGLCVGGRVNDEYKKCIQACPNLKTLQKNDPRCSKDCHECKKEKELCLKNFSNSPRKWVICDKPCPPCEACLKPKLASIQVCHKYCGKTAKLARNERGCDERKQERTSYCKLCNMTPNCKLNKDCKECRLCRQANRRLVHCGYKLKINLRRQFKSFCRFRCLGCKKTAKSKNANLCSTECEQKCSGADIRKNAYNKELLGRFLLLGISDEIMKGISKLENLESQQIEKIQAEEKQFEQKQIEYGQQLAATLEKINSKLSDLHRMEEKKEDLKRNISKTEKKIALDKKVGNSSGQSNSDVKSYESYKSELSSLKSQIERSREEVSQLRAKAHETEQRIKAIQEELLKKRQSESQDREDLEKLNTVKLNLSSEN